MRKSHLSSTKPFSLREGANFSDAIFFQEIKSLVRAFFYCWAQNLMSLWLFGCEWCSLRTQHTSEKKRKKNKNRKKRKRKIKTRVNELEKCSASGPLSRLGFCLIRVYCDSKSDHCLAVFFFQIRENLKVFWISLDALFGILIWDFGLGLEHWNETDTKTWTRLVSVFLGVIKK
ncbi:hypothetical protein RhiirB3_389243 [Rhizophagus irregularis]|nr:hypothetical protein RhiirB3_389243 [Rhizophagus irregularis]